MQRTRTILRFDQRLSPLPLARERENNEKRRFMALISMRDISVGFGGPLVLDGLTFQIERGERVCLVGRNGEGKSTLLSVVSGDVSPDGHWLAYHSDQSGQREIYLQPYPGPGPTVPVSIGGSAAASPGGACARHRAGVKAKTANAVSATRLLS